MPKSKILLVKENISQLRCSLTFWIYNFFFKVSKECSEFEGRPTQPVAGKKHFRKNHFFMIFHHIKNIKVKPSILVCRNPALKKMRK